jgi:hypothetical protein
MVHREGILNCCGRICGSVAQSGLAGLGHMACDPVEGNAAIEEGFDGDFIGGVQNGR